MLGRNLPLSHTPSRLHLEAFPVFLSLSLNLSVSASPSLSPLSLAASLHLSDFLGPSFPPTGGKIKASQILGGGPAGVRARGRVG